jgi:hypothetical protein
VGIGKKKHRIKTNGRQLEQLLDLDLIQLLDYSRFGFVDMALNFKNSIIIHNHQGVFWAMAWLPCSQQSQRPFSGARWHYAAPSSHTCHQHRPQPHQHRPQLVLVGAPWGEAKNAANTLHLWMTGQLWIHDVQSDLTSWQCNCSQLALTHSISYTYTACVFDSKAEERDVSWES